MELVLCRNNTILESKRLVFDVSFKYGANIDAVPVSMYIGANQIGVLNRLNATRMDWGQWTFDKKDEARKFLSVALEYLLATMQAQLSTSFVEETDYRINRAELGPNRRASEERCMLFNMCRRILCDALKCCSI
ncbi:ORF-122 [Agrotis segetum nucleopolyhedrovirus A]|uniref:ORF-122 n=1 Tax=Agrotis segetum nuclear polyhedrosis virus TaxID=1962501 RepID=Q287F0_NPVAS|nr:ORF-122 [Agrotis segetum nucleopolyhedrovirus A]AAZ38288.1 ORF-122 [Agrotis segetum nucleopolyhedrovirus A]